MNLEVFGLHTKSYSRILVAVHNQLAGAGRVTVLHSWTVRRVREKHLVSKKLIQNEALPAVLGEFL